MPPSLEALRHSSHQHQQQQQLQQSQSNNSKQDPDSDLDQTQSTNPISRAHPYSLEIPITRTRPEADAERPLKRQKHIHSDNRSTVFQLSGNNSRLPSRLTFESSANHPNEFNNLDDMSDGSMSRRSSVTSASANIESENEARALRVLEIMNDFRTLQVHITSLVSRPEATPPDQASQYLEGYAVLRQCNAQAQAILATRYSPGSLGIEPGRSVPDTEVQKATLQRIILDASTRRFQAHKIYLTAAAGMRWIQTRQQIVRSNTTADKKAQAMRVIDGRLDTEINDITDESVVNDLRTADRRKNYWVEEDPSLERMLAWIRRQR